MTQVQTPDTPITSEAEIHRTGINALLGVVGTTILLSTTFGIGFLSPEISKTLEHSVLPITLALFGTFLVIKLAHRVLDSHNRAN